MHNQRKDAQQDSLEGNNPDYVENAPVAQRKQVQG
jgi:hypothetical protein